MLFASRKTPKGPDINHPYIYSINLSGSKFSFKMPYGNRTDIPEPQGIFLDSVNIYETDPDEQGYTVLVSRNFNYTGFLGENLGSVDCNILLCRTKNKDINLFNLESFKKHLNNSLVEANENFNHDADESCQITLSPGFEIININDIQFLRYSTSQFEETITTSGYACPITDDCYLKISFRHATVRDESEPWHILSRDLENRIMYSMHLKLSESAQKYLQDAQYIEKSY